MTSFTMTMQIVQSAAALPADLRGGVVCIGNFDGVHVGHQALLRTTLERAASLGAPAIVYTFDPHPTTVLAPRAGVVLLQPLAQRLQTLSTYPLAATVVESFTAAFAAMPAATFCTQVLGAQLAARHLVVGHDFTFGHKRSGHTHDLQQWCAAQQVGCDIVAPVFVGELLVSSTYIRHCVTQGRMEEAAAGLSRPYCISGPLIRGRGVGKQLGFPTLNLVPDNPLLPPPGVYISSAGWTATEHTATHPAATYIGTIPTFGGTTLVVETYLLTDPPPPDITQMTIAFHRQIRGDVRFDSADSLRLQIARDVAAARAYHQLPT